MDKDFRYVVEGVSIKYNQWLYYPPDDVHTLKVWHDTVVNDFDGY